MAGKYPKFRDIKGNEIQLKSGVGRNPDVQIQFIRNGVGRDISAFGELRAIIKQEGKNDASVAQIGMVETVLTVDVAATGLVTIPFEAATINGKMQAAIIIITEEPTKIERGIFEVDLVTANRDIP